MVAGSDDHRHVWTDFDEIHEMAGEGLFHGRSRLLDVEYVAADKECIRMMLAAPRLELHEEMIMLVGPTVILIKDLTYVKVCSMNELHLSIIYRFKSN